MSTAGSILIDFSTHQKYSPVKVEAHFVIFYHLRKFIAEVYTVKLLKHQNLHQNLHQKLSRLLKSSNLEWITTYRITDGIEPLDMVVTKFLFYDHFVINITNGQSYSMI